VIDGSYLWGIALKWWVLNIMRLKVDGSKCCESYSWKVITLSMCLISEGMGRVSGENSLRTYSDKSRKRLLGLPSSMSTIIYLLIVVEALKRLS
jgi:hypothetical protein